MASDPRVERAVEEILDSGCSVREACRDYPELLSQVHERWRRVNAVRVQVGALFPEAGWHPAPEPTSPAPPAGSLPRIPGYEVEGVLGQGVAYGARFDPQAKALGEWLRSRVVPVPVELLPAEVAS